MRRRVRIVIGGLLLLGTLFITPWQIHFATKPPETVATRYAQRSDLPDWVTKWIEERTWWQDFDDYLAGRINPVDYYCQSPKAHGRLLIVKVTGLLGLVGFLLICPELTRGLRDAPKPQDG